MLTEMGRVDVEAQIETTFFIIVHYWSTFDSDSKERAKGLLENLTTTYHSVIETCGKRLPSLTHIDELAEFHSKLELLRQTVDEREAFEVFTQRLNHETLGVILQTLGELAAYLREHQAYLQTSAISQQPHSVVTSLMRALLDCSSKYNGLQTDICRLCAECIGLVGCLDPNRLETSREQKQFVVIQNFSDAGETTDFVVFLLENVLVKSFLSTTDTKMQGFLSFVMQQLLDRCDFKTALSGPMDNDGAAAGVRRKWVALSETAREVLTPFLTSMFGVAPMSYTPAEYPIFRPTKLYANWLKSFVLDLLHKSQNVFADLVFEPLRRVIRVKDLSVTEFLLPYVAMHVVIGQDSSELMMKVATEIMEILQYQPPENASYNEKEEAKVFYGVSFQDVSVSPLLSWATLLTLT
jgi:serine/threonine-protein kinase ATR